MKKETDCFYRLPRIGRGQSILRRSGRQLRERDAQDGPHERAVHLPAADLAADGRPLAETGATALLGRRRAAERVLVDAGAG